MNNLEHILVKSSELFLKYGIKSISMDEISRTMGISKKTLYQYVANKSDLVLKIIHSHLEDEKAKVDHIASHSENAIDEMLQVFDYVCKHRREFNPSILYDLQKYYPDGWAVFQQYKNEFMYSRVTKNLERGMKDGLYRADLNVEVMTKVYLAGIDSTLDQDLFPFSKYTFVSVYIEYIRYHMRGIASDKGLKYLNQHQPTKFYEKV